MIFHGANAINCGQKYYVPRLLVNDGCFTHIRLYVLRDHNFLFNVSQYSLWYINKKCVDPVIRDGSKGTPPPYLG